MGNQRRAIVLIILARLKAIDRQRLFICRMVLWSYHDSTGDVVFDYGYGVITEEEIHIDIENGIVISSEIIDKRNFNENDE